MDTSYKKYTLILILLITILVLIFSYFSYTSSPLKIATHQWLGYQSLPLALDQGWIDSNQVKLVNTMSASDSMQEILSGKVDAATLTLDEAIQLKAKGLDISVVMVFDVSSGADMIIANKNIEYLKQQDNIKIAFENNALGSLMFAEFLNISQFKLKQFEILNIPVNKHLSFWQTQQPDMMITYDPTASILLANGATKIIDTRDMPDIVFDVLVVKNSVLFTHKKMITHIIKGCFAAVKHMMISTEDASYRIASFMNIPKEEVINLYAGIRFLNLKSNYKLMHGSNSILQIKSKIIEKTLKDVNIISQNIKSAIVVSTYVDYLHNQK